MDMLTQKQKILVIAGIAIIAVILIIYYINSTKDIYNYEEANAIEELEEENKNESTEEKKIILHVTGAVINQGIVEVKENSRINDVIEAAGGLTEEANLNNVNLAYPVEDGQKIYIPSKNDEIESEYNEEIVKQNAGENIVKDLDEKESGELININTANAERLTDIPGIGSATAEKIITYRNENGKFKSIEDIKNVSGIGEKKYEAIKAYIKV